MTRKSARIQDIEKRMAEECTGGRDCPVHFSPQSRYITGTRVPERIVRGLIADGLSAEEIAALYPNVTAEHVEALRAER